MVEAIPMQLHNTYWLLRHGRSTANEADLIVAELENGRDPKYGLTEAGRQQALQAGAQLREQLAAAGAASEQLLVLSSPFSRTMQTAELAVSQLGPQFGNMVVQEEAALRERHFGGYELQSCSNYDLVWAEDGQDVERRPPGGGESVADVAQRMQQLIGRLDSAFEGRHIVLVSHGDALSILAAVLLGTDLRSHRQHGLPNCGILCVPAAERRCAAQ